MDPDPNPSIFIIDLQDANKKQIKKKISAYYFLKVLLHHFSKVKVKKKSQNNRNQGFTIFA
jgi:ribosomal protein L23